MCFWPKTRFLGIWLMTQLVAQQLLAIFNTVDHILGIPITCVCILDALMHFHIHYELPWANFCKKYPSDNPILWVY